MEDIVCIWCHFDIWSKNNTFVPVCMSCAEDIQDIYFHRDCIDAIYDKTTQKIKEEFRDQLPLIKCLKCLCEKFDPDVIIQ